MTGRVTKIGIARPTTTPTVAISPVAGAVMEGSYRYCYTYYNTREVFESSPSLSSAEVRVIRGQGVSVSNLVHTTERDVGEVPADLIIKVYRIGGTSAMWQFVRNIERPTVSFIDSTPDSLLVGELGSHDNDLPPRLSSIIYHNNVALGVVAGWTIRDAAWRDKRNLVVASKFNEFQAWRYDEDLDVYKDKYIIGDESPINAFRLFQDNVFVFKDNSVNQMLIDPEGDIGIRNITNTLGTISQKTVFTTENMLGTIDNSGIYLFDGATFNKISDKIGFLFEKKDVPDKRYISSIVYDNKLFVSLPITDVDNSNILLALRLLKEEDTIVINDYYAYLSETKHRTFVLDFARNCWSTLPHKIKFLERFNDIGVSPFARNNLLMAVSQETAIRPVEILMHNAGTATFTTGSPNVVGHGTLWAGISQLHQPLLIRNLATGGRLYEIREIRDNTNLVLTINFEETIPPPILGAPPGNAYSIIRRSFSRLNYDFYRFYNEKDFNTYDSNVDTIQSSLTERGIETSIKTLPAPFIGRTKAFNFGSEILYKRLKAIEIIANKLDDIYLLFLVDNRFFDLHKLSRIKDIFGKKRLTFGDLTFRKLSIGFLGRCNEPFEILSLDLEYETLPARYRKYELTELVDREYNEAMLKVIRRYGRVLVYPPQGGWHWKLRDVR
ncbi:MAG: hypothetical protein DDT19_01088 [Syntrophomonadaceae bacterium]|nr:hypothetical protein [Bacillota bacterium]